uniref:Uncharacterized protein n=1 Tax=Arundo donax TaxID=35708 RepID=A0A0A8ZD14_ARUDO
MIMMTWQPLTYKGVVVFRSKGCWFEIVLQKMASCAMVIKRFSCQVTVHG